MSAVRERLTIAALGLGGAIAVVGLPKFLAWWMVWGAAQLETLQRMFWG